ncbi:MAG: adenylate/guanylate cyclase domain-containing protein [Zoogloeaceae bacterium]|nr:adenylate/guanylate cyclase domain-containing protein [Zoogloeaceae bacterium]
MNSRRNLCVLATEVIGGATLAQRLGEVEGKRAVDRCVNRVGRVVESNHGLFLHAEGDRLIAGFERCDTGVQAACEMLERVASLPPNSGVRLAIHVGVHYGPVDVGARPEGEAMEFASRLQGLARPGEALASGPTVVLLSPATRQFAGLAEERAPSGAKFDWPIYLLGARGGITTSLPPASRLSQRLQVRHQQDFHVVEDHRPILLLGRELGNDVVVIDPRASRQHARIERRREGFVLVDQSTNGTFVILDGQPEQCVKRAEMALVGQGRIGCGFSANEVERDLIFFEIV